MQRRSGGRGLGAVLFTDIVGSTAIAAEMGNTRWSELVARHHRIVRRAVSRFGGHEVDTAGDGFFVSFERPADAIRAAVEASEAVRELGIEIRAGVGFGELEAVSGKPGGLVVNAAARVMAVAGPGEVLVPASLRDLVLGAGVTFAEHGVHQFKGIEGDFHLFKVMGVDGEALALPLEADEAVERRREIFPAGRRRGPLIAGLAAGVLAVIIGASILLFGPSDKSPGEVGSLQNAVARIDAESGKILSTIDLDRDPALGQFINHPLAAGEGGVWVLEPPQLLHVDPIYEQVRSDQIAVGVTERADVGAGLGAVWVLGGQFTVYRVDPATDEVEPFLDMGASQKAPSSISIADAIWAGFPDGTVIRVDPSTGARDQVDIGHPVDRLAATRKTVWVVDLLAGEVIRIDQASLRASGRPIPVSGSVDQIVAGGDSLWILDRQAGAVTVIDATTGAIRGPVRVGDSPTDIALGLDSVWIGDRNGSLFRLDPSTLEVKRLPIGAEVIGVAVDEDAESLWVYLGESVTPTAG
jgi:class 3 adenylate cyclase/streptogramin lyase